MRPATLALTLAAGLPALLPACKPQASAQETARSAPGAGATPLKQSESLIIDVRTPGEYAQGHVAGAVNIPMNRIDEIERALGAKDAQAVLYCSVGARSGQVIKALRAKGYTGLSNGGGPEDVARRLGLKLTR